MRLCRIVLVGFGVLYSLAMVLFLIGAFGLFGQERDPMSAAFLVILGQPWIRLVDSLSEAGRLVAMVLSPGVTLAVLWGLCRFAGRART